MRHSIAVIVGLTFAVPLSAQSTSADSAAVVALELELTRLLAAGRIDEYATHLTANYARTTRPGQAGIARRGSRQLASPEDPQPRPTRRAVGPRVRRCGRADEGSRRSRFDCSRHADYQDVRAPARALAAGGATRLGYQTRSEMKGRYWRRLMWAERGSWRRCGAGGTSWLLAQMLQSAL
jgi:hypothetical protein